jgi:hypothetical protein
MKPTTTLFYLLLLVVITTFSACETYHFRSNYKDANALIHGTERHKSPPFLKAHLKNGDICILQDTWTVDTLSEVVLGNGKRFDYNRKRVFVGAIRLPFDSISIFETNIKLKETEHGRLATLGILLAVNLPLSIYCLSNPKACFGSCPTFYVEGNDNFHSSDAEGFSNAITPSMEYGDIDALNNTPLSSHSFSITMKNEALETHCVKDVKLLAYPRQQGERVYAAPGDEFYRCQNTYPLSAASANEGDVTALLQTADKQERFSLSDERNLSKKETIYLNFDNVSDCKDLGLVLNFRQTLMTTYLIYGAMGYMGDEVSDVFNLLQRHQTLNPNSKGGLKKELGGVEIHLWNNQKNVWEKQGEHYETGPIAINKQLTRLKSSNSLLPNTEKVKLKIVLNQGLWRLDYVALTNIKEKITPLSIAPSRILNKEKEDKSALNALNDPTLHLISMPGSAYQFQFDLPTEHQDYELFLYSKGYYLEWMREDWLKDKNLRKLKTMALLPKKYLKDEAQNYKRYETYLEQDFWNSRIDTKTFSYYDK